MLGRLIMMYDRYYRLRDRKTNFKSDCNLKSQSSVTRNLLCVSDVTTFACRHNITGSHTKAECIFIFKKSIPRSMSLSVYLRGNCFSITLTPICRDPFRSLLYSSLTHAQTSRHIYYTRIKDKKKCKIVSFY